MVSGTHGLLTRQRLLLRSDTLQRDTASLEAVRGRLQRDVALLAEEPPHPDLVDEIAREVLGFVRPGDLIVSDQINSGPSPDNPREPRSFAPAAGLR